MSKCHFHIEIYAPSGLSGIEPHLAACRMPLEPHRSGFNGQVILRYVGSDDTDFAMDPSNEKTMYASGYIYTEVSDAWPLLESLSDALRRAGFPHWIGLDDEESERAFSVQYKVKSGLVSPIEYEA
jgi:hypothetical protein